MTRFALLLSALLLACVPAGSNNSSDGSVTVDAAEPTPDAAVEACGDGVCAADEGCSSCPADCACAAGERCEADACQGCERDCQSRICGADGCGGECGQCEGEELCTAEGRCADPPASCGDATCDADEDCATCPADCGACCGDGECRGGEDCGTCPADCGACCGDGACRPDQGEDCAACQADCGCPEGQRCEAEGARCVELPADCGNGACGEDEDCDTCPADCPCGEGEACEAGLCVAGPSCGDEVCDPDEHCGNCEADCLCPAGQRCEVDACVVAEGLVCGDEACEPGETCETCPADCGACCGDGACRAQHDEDCQACPADCGACCGDGECVAEHGEDCAACGLDCGCEGDEVCDVERRLCACVPDCEARVCGPDGCGGECAPNSCPMGSACSEGACVAQPGCGDQVCAVAEDCTTCPADCGCGEGQRCDPDSRRCECDAQCGDRVCGPDACNGVCGVCDEDEACVEGRCVADCAEDCGEAWGLTCSGDGFGYRVCAPDPEAPGCTAPSRRVPCAEGRACEGEAGEASCEGGCVVPEVLVLLDRSSSMTMGGRWDFTRAALDQMLGAFGRRARIGVRAFPSEAQPCEAGGIAPLVFEPDQAFDAIPAPAAAAQTPIHAAFDEVELAFGDPDESEAVLLITDGDETCAEEDAVVARVEGLAARGIRTFAVGISRQANGELLERIAVAGGTATEAAPRYLLVEDQEELLAAISEVYSRLEVCPCAAGQRACDGDDRLVCAEDLGGFEVAEVCDFGCRTGTGTCRPVCRPGAEVYDCLGDLQLACNVTGTAFEGERVDCEFGCSAPGGCHPVCRPGTTRCADGATLETCRADGTGFDAAPCPDICVLSADACGASGVCREGDVRCAGPGLQQCDVQGAGFELSEACQDICLAQHGRCPSDQLGDAYELDGILYMRGPQGWGGVVGVDGWGSTLGCFTMGYTSAGGLERVRNALQGDLRYTVTCDGAGWLGECQFRVSQSRDGVRLGCGARGIGRSYCFSNELNMAYLGEGVFRPFDCGNGCDSEPGACRANPFECQAGQACNFGPQQVMISRGFGPGTAAFADIEIEETTDLRVSAYGVDLNPACSGNMRAVIRNAQNEVLFGQQGPTCSSVFGNVTLEPGTYRFVVDNPGGNSFYDVRVALQVSGPR